MYKQIRRSIIEMRIKVPSQGQILMLDSCFPKKIYQSIIKLIVYAAYIT